MFAAADGVIGLILKREPEVASITLLGPGVNPTAREKTRTAVKVCRDIIAQSCWGALKLGQSARADVPRRRMVVIWAIRLGAAELGFSGVVFRVGQAACPERPRLLNTPSYRDFSL